MMLLYSVQWLFGIKNIFYDYYYIPNEFLTPILVK